MNALVCPFIPFSLPKMATWLGRNVRVSELLGKGMSIKERLSPRNSGVFPDNNNDFLRASCDPARLAEESKPSPAQKVKRKSLGEFSVRSRPTP